MFTEDFDFTMRDFQAFDERLKDLQESVFPNLTDTDVVSIMNYLRSTASFVGSRNDYYLAQLKREAFVPTMRERRSAILHGRRQGYSISGATAATADVVVTLQNGPLAGSITFSKGDQIKTAEVPTAIIGEIQQDAVMAAGETEITLSWKHAVTRQVTFTSTGKARQKFVLPEAPYLDESVTAETVAGSWTEVDDFLDSRATDRHFTVFVDQDNIATITTGDDQNGAIPRGQITFTYETGGGPTGEVEKDSLSKMVSTYYDSFGTQAILTATNPERATGGEDRETVNAAKVNIPAERRLAKSTIAEEDFEIRALNVSGVGRALFLTPARDSAVPDNEGRLYVVPPSGGTPAQSVLDAVLEEVTVTYPTMPTFTVNVVAADYKTIDIYAVVYLRKGYSASTVKASILANLTEWFRPLASSDSTPNMNVDFGWNYKDIDDNPAGSVAFSDIFNVVRDTAGVRKISPGLDEFLLNGKHDDVDIDNWEFPAKGTVTLINGDTGLAF